VNLVYKKYPSGAAALHSSIQVFPKSLRAEPSSVPKVLPEP